MRPWRDIPSLAAWQAVVARQDSTASMSRSRRLRAKVKSSTDTPKRALERLTDAIARYHDVPKTSFGRLDDRARQLTEIAAAAGSYLTKFHVDMDAAKGRFEEQYSGVHGWQRVALQKRAHSNRYEAGNAADQSIDRTVLTLLNRGLRKARYLLELKQYYTSTSRDPKHLVTALTRPQDKSATHTGLHAGVRMEQLDPWHRPVEVSFQNGQLQQNDDLADEYDASAAFGEWYASIGQHDLPFFLWLESHAICTADDKALIAGTASVTYVSGNDRANGYRAIAPRHKLALVYPHGGKLWLDELKPNGVTRVADTAGYACNSGKGVSDAAAFTAVGREITIAQHQESSFHHSSFHAGGNVNCAGMIKIDNGFVTYASNNSGHYRPDKQLLARFLHGLAQKGLLARDCTVHCSGLGRTYEDTATNFLRDWQSL